MKSNTNFLFLFIIGIFIITTIACNEDKDTFDDNDEMVGTWLLHELEADDGTVLSRSEFEKQITIIFTETNYSVTEYDAGGETGSISGTWERTGSATIEISMSGHVGAETRIMSKEGKYYYFWDAYYGKMKYKKQ
jgi:hypothetical protein